MSAEKRVVIDTNVFVSALFDGASVPWTAVDTAFAEGTVLFTRETFSEFETVLSRRKLDKYVDPADRDEFLTFAARDGAMVEVTEAVSVIPRTTSSWRPP